MLLFLPILILFALSSREIGGQVINLDNLELETTCTDSLMSGTDQYSFNGTYGPKFLELSNNSGWISFVTIEILRTGATSFADICSVAMGTTGKFCSSEFISRCYCKYIDTNGTAHISVRNRANFTHSQAIIRGAWQNKNGTNVYSTNNLTLPKIYDPNAAVLVLSLNDEEVVETSSDYCNSSFIFNAINTLKLCCSNTATPCYPRIALNGTIVADNQFPCVIYTFTIIYKHYKVNVTRSYSVCSLNNIITDGSCMIETSNKKTTTALISTSTITTGKLEYSTGNTREYSTSTTRETTITFTNDTEGGNTWLDIFATYMLLNNIALCIYFSLKWINKEEKYSDLKAIVEPEVILVLESEGTVTYIEKTDSTVPSQSQIPESYSTL